jgi:hypothetical protein
MARYVQVPDDLIAQFYYLQIDQYGNGVCIPATQIDEKLDQIPINTQAILDTKIHSNDSLNLILDNQARINNLEDEEVRKILSLMDKWSIKVNFQDINYLEIEYFRKHITSLMIVQLEKQTDSRIITRKYISPASCATEKDILDDDGNIISKKVILNFGNKLLTGYAIIL